MKNVDKFVGITFKVMVVLCVLVIASKNELRPDIYRMVSVPVEGFIGILLVYIGGKWVLTKLGFFHGESIKVTKKALVKTLGAVAAMILFSASIELLCHNLSLTQQATADLQSSTIGRDALGDPIRVGWFISGNMRGGAASFSIPVKGSEAAGELEVRGTRKDGSWHIVDLYLIVDGNRAVVQIPH